MLPSRASSASLTWKPICREPLGIPPDLRLHLLALALLRLAVPRGPTPKRQKKAPPSPNRTRLRMPLRWCQVRCPRSLVWYGTRRLAPMCLRHTRALPLEPCIRAALPVVVVPHLKTSSGHTRTSARACLSACCLISTKKKPSQEGSPTLV